MLRRQAARTQKRRDGGDVRFKLVEAPEKERRGDLGREWEFMGRAPWGQSQQRSSLALELGLIWMRVKSVFARSHSDALKVSSTYCMGRYLSQETGQDRAAPEGLQWLPSTMPGCLQRQKTL
jgi:hypothetical protein